MCLVGAFEEATLGEIEIRPLLRRQLRRACDGASPVSYNDMPDRTWADIAGALDRLEQIELADRVPA